jgi:hypothetical protein
MLRASASLFIRLRELSGATRREARMRATKLLGERINR